MCWPGTQQPREDGKMSSEEEESFLKKGDDNFIFLWKTLSSLPRTSTDLRPFFSLAFPGHLHCTTDVILPLYFWSYSSLLCNYSCLHFWKVINMLINAALCLSNLKIRKAAKDQTTNPCCCNAADEGLWNTAVVLDNYHLGETFGMFMHQIYPPCSTDHVQPGKCSLGTHSPAFVTETVLASFGSSKVTPLIFKGRCSTSGQRWFSISEEWGGRKIGHCLGTNEWTNREITKSCTSLTILD